ncbi:hypothetical protein QMZ92_32335 [Streptomyces sp. HNM0645]|uniref:hypothetical protein n=1 Tax=Streptomyces sp. HNM0645 TaxID=2782343 RepID=UPI0024B856EA|nr:hypothetical protein [Streptomyces sp. HNM0645]MDI9888914.1 hypothetical protein [Streptomyces sp. HNM0645]
MGAWTRASAGFAGAGVPGGDVGALVVLIAGASASSQRRTWLTWINGVPFGCREPGAGSVKPGAGNSPVTRSD